jgi:hypothetical protein
MTISLATATRNAKLDAITTQIGNAGLLRIYDGTPPASANAALSGNNKLSENVCGSPYAAASAAAVLTANAITTEASANASGTAAFYRVYKADGTTCIAQGTVGTSGADLNLNTANA